MKTTLSKAQSYKLPSGKTVQIPDGLRVIPATNLPEDSAIKYWLDELTPAMRRDRETESHFRCYGFGFRLDEVTEQSEYDTQAESFLAKHGLKFRATLSDSKTPAWSDGGKHGHHYRVTLSKEPLKMWEVLLQYPDDTRIHCIGRAGTKTEVHNLLNKKLSSLLPEYAKKCIPNIVGKITRKPDRLTLDFWGSISDAEKGIVTVKPYDVLACISSDATTPETFAEFCDEFGGDPDSLKELQNFRRCDRFAKRLRAFFTPQELEDLAEIQ